MADYENEELDDVYEEVDEDNAAALTSGLVLTTSLLLCIAIFITFKALDTYFGVGPMASN